MIKQNLPYISLPTAGGEWINLNKLLQGRRSLLFFWSTFAPDSVNELISLNKAVPDEFVLMICMNIHKHDLMNKVLSENNIKHTCLVDNMLTSVRLLNVLSVPYYIKLNFDLSLNGGGSRPDNIGIHRFEPSYTPFQYEKILQDVLTFQSRKYIDEAKNALIEAHHQSNLSIVEQQLM